jgi:hypothetical protein
MERISSKHSPRVDDQLEHELEPLERSAHESRVEEFREQEPAGDYEPEAGGPLAPEGAEGWRVLGHDPVTARRELSRHLDRSTFPAEREALLAEAEDNDAPQEVLDVLRALPAGITFTNLYEVWQALGGPIEQATERKLDRSPQTRQ